MPPHAGPGGGMPPALHLGTADLAYLRATGGTPLPLAFVFRFDGPAPDPDALRARVAERAPRIPALRYRLVRDHGQARREDRLDGARHVHEASLPEDTDGAGAARLMLRRPLGGDDRPPWEVWLVRGPGGGHSLCYRTDHTFQDGVGAAHTARALLDDHPSDDGPAARPRARPTLRGLADTLADVAGTFRAPVPKPGFDGPPAGLPGVCQTEVPLARLRTVGRAHGATVNDVYLAALAHAVHVWHMKETGTAHPPLPVAVPMSVRAPGDEYAPGNHMVSARFRLPCDESTPRGALDRVTAATGRLRRTRRRDAVRLMLDVTPRALGARLGPRLVNGSVVAGPASSVDFGPALVHGGAVSRRSAVFAGLAAGLRFLTTLTGQHDTACLTVVHDETLPAVDEIPGLWLAALWELERE